MVPVDIGIEAGDNRLRIYRNCTVQAHRLFSNHLLVLGLDSELFAFFDKQIFCDDGGMGLLPAGFEFLEFLTEDLLSVLLLEVFSEFGNSFELHEDFLEMAAALGGSAALQVFLKGLEDFAGSK